MSAKQLVDALRDLAGDVYQLRDDAHGDAARAKTLDHAGLALEVLAHVVDGKTIEKAFGAPGDWGYGTPIGIALRAMLNTPRCFDVYRFAGESSPALTVVERHGDERRRADALANPRCIGIVEGVAARNQWAAIDLAEPRFAALDCTLGPRGRELAAARGGAA